MYKPIVSTIELQQVMRYVAVFTLFDIPVAKGFASEEEAIRCLEKADNDPDSSPIGIYDAQSGAVTFDEYEEYSSAAINRELIVRLARSYIERIV
ncbi:hypothetical protein GCM10028819_20730 [Spirosoma humi]